MGASKARRRKRRLKGWLWLGIVVALLGVAVPRWTGSLVRGWFTPTFAARSGPLEETVRRQGLALWREKVVASPGAGALHILVPEGQRVQKGQMVAMLESGRVDWREAALRSEAAEDGEARAIRGGGQAVYAPEPGLIRFDWMEPPRPDPSEVLDWRDDVLEGIGTTRVVRAQGAAVRSGETLFRLVENHRAYLFVPWEGAPPVSEGQRVWVRELAQGPAARGGGSSSGGTGPGEAGSGGTGNGSIRFRGTGIGRASTGEAGAGGEGTAGGSGQAPSGGGDGRPGSHVWDGWEAAGLREWEATVVATRPVPSGSVGDGILLYLHAWPPGWETRNWIDVEVVVNRFEGAIIPETLLVQRGGRWGVMVRGRRGPVFHPVVIRGRAEGKVAVDGLAPGLTLIAGSF